MLGLCGDYFSRYGFPRVGIFRRDLLYMNTSLEQQATQKTASDSFRRDKSFEIIELIVHFFFTNFDRFFINFSQFSDIACHPTASWTSIVIRQLAQWHQKKMYDICGLALQIT